MMAGGFHFGNQPGELFFPVLQYLQLPVRHTWIAAQQRVAQQGPGLPEAFQLRVRLLRQYGLKMPDVADKVLLQALVYFKLLIVYFSFPVVDPEGQVKDSAQERYEYDQQQVGQRLAYRPGIYQGPEADGGDKQRIS